VELSGLKLEQRQEVVFDDLGMQDVSNKFGFREAYKNIAEADFDRNYGDNKEVIEERRAGSATRQQWKQVAEEEKKQRATRKDAKDFTDEMILLMSELIDSGVPKEKAFDDAFKLILKKDEL